ncbi:MAG TPA: cysteine desulfurase family protein [Candidatus Bathyarchaeia archaeon]|nr:MAG: cysteine desulfurase NifS [Candidatus Bathyarchaeota archaeon RBG_16_48_13]HJX24255.1 cysteine desulfurase family protein [Candidatus Bathyarchaeia archaeon]
MKRICFDYQAGYPADQRIVEVMLPYFTEFFGNPSSIHFLGEAPRKALENARMKVAELVNANKKEEIIFNSGATEGNNLALLGVAYRNKDRGRHIITTKIEHISIRNLCKHLEKQGFMITYLPVDKCGVVDPEVLKKEITDETILVSMNYANGEIGTIEPIREMGELTRRKNIYLHVDAVAAAGKIPIDVQKDNVDLVTISSNDMYGPKGVGALYVKEGTKLSPQVIGGGQERGLRSGTEDIPGIVGLGKAAELAKVEMVEEGSKMTALRDRLMNGLLGIPDTYLNGHPTQRLPSNANLRFSYVEGESLLLSLDMEGIAVSSGSACTSKTLEPSPVLLAIGLKHEEAHGSLSFTMSKYNAREDVDYAIEVLPKIVTKLRAISPLTPR